MGLVQMFSASASLLRERPLWLRQTSAWMAKLKELSNLKTSGALAEHLAEIEQTARKMVEQTVARMAQAEGVTEELKATDPLRWTGLMNNLRHCAEELVLTDLIYA